MTRHSLCPSVLEISTSIIRDYLLENSRCEEYDLIKLLTENKVCTWSKDYLQALYQKHFIVRHCLYASESFFSDRGFALELSPLEIAIRPLQSVDVQARLPHASSQNIPLKSFYLDLENYQRGNAEYVAELMANFWKDFSAYENASESRKVLGVSGAATWAEIVDRYRVLARTHHPDRGGDPEKFNAIKEAYEDLRRHRKSNL